MEKVYIKKSELPEMLPHALRRITAGGQALVKLPSGDIVTIAGEKSGAVMRYRVYGL